MTETSAIVIGKTMTAVGNTSGGVQLSFRRKLAGFHPRHRGDWLPSTARVIGIHRPTQQGLFGI